MEIKIAENSYNEAVPADDRKIFTSSSAFGILRQQLVRNIGIERIKGFLFQFGWETGVHDAKEALQTDLPLESLIKYGPTQHIKNGHIRGMIKHDCAVELDENQAIISLFNWYLD